MIPELIFHQHEALIREWEQRRHAAQHPTAPASRPTAEAPAVRLPAALRRLLRWIGAAPARNRSSE